MKSIYELLQKEKKHTLTPEEAKYLERYKARKLKHSPSFVMHSRELPEEKRGSSRNTLPVQEDK